MQITVHVYFIIQYLYVVSSAFKNVSVICYTVDTSADSIITGSLTFLLPVISIDADLMVFFENTSDDSKYNKTKSNMRFWYIIVIDILRSGLYSVVQINLSLFKVIFLTSRKVTLIYLKIFKLDTLGGWGESGIKVIDVEIMKWKSFSDK